MTIHSIVDFLLKNQILSTGLLITVLGSMFYSLKEVPKLIIDKFKGLFMFSVTIYENDELYNYFEKWLFHQHPKTYKNIEAFLSDKKDESVVYKQHSGFNVVRYGGKRILIVNSREKMDKIQDYRNLFFREYKISAFFGKAKIRKLLDEVVKFNRDKNKGRIMIYQVDSMGNYRSNGLTIPARDKNMLYFNNNIKELFDDLDLFMSSKDWYLKRGIPYKRGYLFSGPPGNGKSSLSMAIATHTGKNIFSININSLTSDNALIEAFNYNPENTIILIEDIDSVFHGRKPVNKNCKLTFSTLLNCMDGVFYKEGSLTIVTTNHIELLDPALIRHGRIDSLITIENPTKETIERYLSNFYDKQISLNEYNKNYSMSKIQELCITNQKNTLAVISELETII